MRREVIIYLLNKASHACPDGSARAIPCISSPYRRIRSTKSMRHAAHQPGCFLAGEFFSAKTDAKRSEKDWYIYLWGQRADYI